MPPSAANLRSAIEDSYTAFASAMRPKRLNASPYRDADTILRTLTATPLRELTENQIGPYSGWAITTVGDADDYRHFLPRIFELSASPNSSLGMEPPIMASRIMLGEWRNWPNDQQSAVLRFFRSAFDMAVNVHPECGTSAEDWLCGLTTLGEPASPYVMSWLSSTSSNAALQLADFIIKEAKNLRRHSEIRGPFWDDVNPEERQKVAQLLLQQQTKQFLESARNHVSEDDQFYFVDSALAELPQ